jgi:hypothetical protein
MINLEAFASYDIRCTRIVVTPNGEPIFSEMGTTIEIDDEAAGEFVRVKQESRIAKAQQIAIDVVEWPAIKAAIEFMLSECRSET